MRKVNVLGTGYEIRYLGKDDDTRLETIDGYCDFYSKLIVICNDKDGNIHDFLYESGLAQNSNDVSQWAYNEEMVDWFAIQGKKIYKAWEEAGAVG